VPRNGLSDAAPAFFGVEVPTPLDFRCLDRQLLVASRRTGLYDDLESAVRRAIMDDDMPVDDGRHHV
jgi:hypothetical protein